MNIDERLEEITKDNVQYLAPTQALAQALLRARQALRVIDECWCAGGELCARHDALADTELEEAL